MLTQAELWELRPQGSNPCRNVRRYKMKPRERFLSVDELNLLGFVLDHAEDAQAAAAIRLLLFTGARSSEITGLRWDWIRGTRALLPDTKTGPRTISLSPEAARVLAAIPRVDGNPSVIPERIKGKAMRNLNDPWDVVCARAGLEDMRTGGETPFEQRTDFVTAMEAGGVAAMEVVARDLKALGLYQARALSYDGVEVEPLEHPLSPEQRRIYDAYAGAFKVIHRNLEDALKATGIMEGDATLNKNAKSAALSAFEGAKQRFFGHLLTAMKCPSLIRSVEANLEAGHACVIQLVSTGEALLDRRIADIPVSEWDDISVDLTPRRGVPGISGPRLPGAIAGTVHRRRGQPDERGP